MALPLGWRPGTREHFAGTDTPDKIADWVYLGQGGPHRKAMIEALGVWDVDHPYYTMMVTDGFAQGIDQSEYLDEMAVAKVAPCPPGPNTPDTFRLYEALEAGCVPVVEPDTRTFLARYGLDVPSTGGDWAGQVRRWAENPDGPHPMQEPTGSS